MTRFSFGLALSDLVRIGTKHPYILVRPWMRTNPDLFVTETYNHEEGKRFEDALKLHEVEYMKWVHSDD